MQFQLLQPEETKAAVFIKAQESLSAPPEHTCMSHNGFKVQDQQELRIIDNHYFILPLHNREVLQAYLQLHIFTGSEKFHLFLIKSTEKQL